MDDDLRSLWTSDPAPLPPPPSPEALAARATSFRRTIARRNASEWGAALLVALSFLWIGYRADQAPIQRLGCGLILAATASIAWKLRSSGTNLPLPPPDAPTAEHLRHHRLALQRQHELLAGVPRWYLAPIVPGMSCFLLSALIESPLASAPLPTRLLVGALFILIVGALLGLVAWLNRAATRKLAREIEALS